MFDRTKGFIQSGIAGIAGLFAESIFQPDNWLPSGAGRGKRPRYGSYGKANPAGFSAKDRSKPRRERYLRLAPDWSNPDRLMARGHGPVHGGRFVLPSPYPYQGMEVTTTKARPHRDKHHNIVHCARTKGNNGPTINKRLRAKFYAGKGGGKQAARLGVML